MAIAIRSNGQISFPSCPQAPSRRCLPSVKPGGPAPQNLDFSTGSARPSAPDTTAIAPRRPTSIGSSGTSSSTASATRLRWAPPRSPPSSRLALRDKVAASTQNQALRALLFLYREVLGVELPWLDDVVRAKRPQHLPVALRRDEVRAILQRLDGVSRLMALLLYGAGLRLLECCHLRVKDIDFAMNQIVIRDGKGRKDRVTMLPVAVKDTLIAHLVRAREQHQADLRAGAGWVELPNALTRKYPNTGRDWGWQWVFPATRF